MTMGHTLTVKTVGLKIVCDLQQMKTFAYRWLEELPKYKLITTDDLKNILQEIIDADESIPDIEVAFLYKELMLCKNNIILALRP